MSTDKPSMTIIGPGKVGRAIGRVAHRVGWPVVAAAGGTHPDRTKEFAAAVGASVGRLAEAAAAGQLVLLTVKDQAIQPVCQQLAAAGGLDHKPIVAHCSGALDSDALAAAADLGCPVGTMHPLQTFPSAEAAIARLPGTYWFIEGGPDAAGALDALAEAMGGRAVRIDAAVKPLYHAAAVMSANYITTLLDAAVDLYAATGLERESALQAAAPIARATVSNVLEQGTEASLTGPIARGDVETVCRHVAALGQHDPAVADLYRAVGRRTVKLALRKGTIDESTAAELTDLLGKE
ncbi:MAG: DUF2520 domain-containing protein [Phycisphaerae bacterium]|nr:DUF2520 domain-containing protein [Phycisphaerae bacterium]